MTDWNLAETMEVVARLRPEAPALLHGARTITWAEMDRRAGNLGAALMAAGCGHQAKVAQYLFNSPEYIESVYAAMKVAMVPVNTNYRYTADELVYLWDNADAEAVVFDAAFAERIEPLRDRLPGVRLWLQVGAGARLPAWATDYEEAAGSGPGGAVRPPWGRSGDDLLLIYTGGTTGMPKGVMWRQDDLWAVLNRSANLRYPEDGTLADVEQRLITPRARPPVRLLPGPPLMHGTGMLTAVSALCSGGALVLLESRSFSATELLDAIDLHRATELVIVGDAFARPLLAALDAEPDRWDLSSLWLIVSSGVMWSAEVRAGLLRHRPSLTLVDTLGSSEAIGMARSRASKGVSPSTAGFTLTEDTRVIADDGSFVAPGSGERGLIAIRGRGPIGYYKDPEKSAGTFRVVDGERWTVPGDYAVLEEDGTVRLLGRGSVCINTGGEKVFPEEVEEVLKRHPDVVDAVVVGVPDERFGEVVVAMVEPAAGADPRPEALIGWVRESLAPYKSPRQILTIPTVGRAANGKVDYRGLRARAIEELGSPG